MSFSFNRRMAAKVAFVCGLLLMLIGSAFLLGTAVERSGKDAVLSFLVVLAGSGVAGLAIKLNKRPHYLFFSTFFIFLGFFLFLSSIRVIPINIRDWWPLASIFAGLALIPAGWRQYGAVRAIYIVPAAAFIILGSFLLVFSLHIVQFSFKQFILNWWPLLFALAGVILALLSLGRKRGTGDAD